MTLAELPIILKYNVCPLGAVAEKLYAHAVVARHKRLSVKKAFRIIVWLYGFASLEWLVIKDTKTCGAMCVATSE